MNGATPALPHLPEKLWFYDWLIQRLSHHISSQTTAVIEHHRSVLFIQGSKSVVNRLNPKIVLYLNNQTG